MTAIEKLGFCFDDSYLDSIFDDYREIVHGFMDEIAFFSNQYKQAITQISPDATDEKKEELYNDVVNAYNPQIEYCKYVMAVQINTIKEKLNEDLIKYLGDSLEYFYIMHESMFEGDNPLEQSREAIASITKMKVPYVFENQPVIQIELTVRVLHGLHILKSIENGMQGESKTPLFELQMLMNYYTRIIPNFDDMNYYKTTLAISNKHKQTISRKSNESELREKALQLFKVGHPTQKRKWKNRTEFKNYFLITHNSSIKDEKKWIKEATLNRWIKEFFLDQI